MDEGDRKPQIFKKLEETEQMDINDYFNHLNKIVNNYSELKE